MTIEERIIDTLKQSEIGLRSADIATAIGKPKPSVRLRLAKMYDRYLVSRELVNRGQYLYKLTNKGEDRGLRA